MTRASGSMFGLAYGDALGAPTEFLGLDEIRHRYGDGGPDGPEGDPWRVTDDTQMGLAVAEGLIEAGGDPSPERLAAIWSRRFVAWAESPENDRAPGMTCLRACAGLAEGRPWAEATQAGSKGCGANMRVTPVGLVPGWSDADRAGAAQLQAALTHGHPTGLAASELTAFTVRWLREGLEPSALPGALRDRAHAQRTTYHERWLGGLWRQPGVDSPEAFAARGWDECLAVLDRLDAALAAPDPSADPCAATGAGWVAEEALATALLCFLLFPGDPVRAIRRGAVSSGDSDSIACLAGAFAGARHGLHAWPRAWADRIEYAPRLARAGAAWD
ncbi:ADP-ribosyl-[dinitrogen reductase] glycohydrolase [Actinomadura rubteroloni]|uniref:ADP-ribosyl-[dinitrogen reductase] glycohydrolase n=1 Tax=Actinomadura rubteroloni TaxID=1926885 RepID=A0A2P4UE69_9ACTN|nr:ADP-ribosylglycohydrolase family protein [Actinomadura rubteroloni]POM23353.1 ADP-ribosyl-[dinitrogen reductase] glycohydrolase [Actinomadura rubteroloni]